MSKICAAGFQKRAWKFVNASGCLGTVDRSQKYVVEVGNMRKRLGMGLGVRNECTGSKVSGLSRKRLGEVIDVCGHVVGLENS
jgi:hypothetical protein